VDNRHLRCEPITATHALPRHVLAADAEDQSSTCMSNPKTPKSDAAIKRWGEFAFQVQKRLENGKNTYGDTSFDKPLAELLDEIQQECLDLAGWGFVLYCRIEEMRKAIG
jgi:hypothetical protein